MSSLPQWINGPVYRRTPLAHLQKGLAVLRAQLGYRDSLSNIGDLSGIPLAPPPWVRAKTWGEFSGLMPTPKEMDSLVDDIFARSLAFEREERKRRAALANCEHEWNVVHGVRTKACVKCGLVEDVLPKPQLVSGHDAA